MRYRLPAPGHLPPPSVRIGREPIGKRAVSGVEIVYNPMKTSLFVTLAAVSAVAFTGCNKSTQSADASSEADSRTASSTDYTASSATTNNTVTGTNTEAGLRTDANRVGNEMRSEANELGNEMRSAANAAGTALSNAASSVATNVRLAEWNLQAEDIRADLAAGREIVRTKDAAAGAPTGSSDKSMVKNMVNSRLQADSSLAALELDVNAQGNGHVELEGKAQNAEQVGRAIALALDTEGVNKVTSKIKLDKDANQ